MAKSKKRNESEQQKKERIQKDLEKNKGMSKFQRKEMARRISEFPDNQVEA